MAESNDLFTLGKTTPSPVHKTDRNDIFPHLEDLMYNGDDKATSPDFDEADDQDSPFDNKKYWTRQTT